MHEGQLESPEADGLVMESNFEFVVRAVPVGEAAERSIGEASVI